MTYRLLWTLALLACAGTPSGGNSGGTVDLRLEQVASGLSDPLYLTAPASDPRAFIVEQPGRIKILQNGRVRPTPFLDIVSKVSSGGERGLLSMAWCCRSARTRAASCTCCRRTGTWIGSS